MHIVERTGSHVLCIHALKSRACWLGEHPHSLSKLLPNNYTKLGFGYQEKRELAKWHLTYLETFEIQEKKMLLNEVLLFTTGPQCNLKFKSSFIWSVILSMDILQARDKYQALWKAEMNQKRKKKALK